MEKIDISSEDDKRLIGEELGTIGGLFSTMVAAAAWGVLSGTAMAAVSEDLGTTATRQWSSFAEPDDAFEGALEHGGAMMVFEKFNLILFCRIVLRGC